MHASPGRVRWIESYHQPSSLVPVIFHSCRLLTAEIFAIIPPSDIGRAYLEKLEGVLVLFAAWLDFEPFSMDNDNPQIDTPPKMQKAVASDEQAASAAGPSTSSTVDYPMENDWEYVHGRVDPGVDESIHLVEGIAAEESSQEGRYNSFLSSSDENEETSVAAQFNFLHGMHSFVALPYTCQYLLLPHVIIFPEEHKPLFNLTCCS